jgi:hypothetical protein
VDIAEVRQVVAGINRRLPEQDERRVGDVPLSGLQLRSCAQPELVEQDSRNRVGVRMVRHLRPPVPGNGPAVQFRCADLSVHIGRNLPVMTSMPESRCLTSDSGCTWITTGSATCLVYQNLYKFAAENGTEVDLIPV